MTVVLGARRTVHVVVAIVACVVMAACVPSSTPGQETPPPPVRAVVDPTSGGIGTVLHVAPGNARCLAHGSAYLQASITQRGTGFVITSGYAWVGSAPISPNASNDPFVTLTVPPNTAPGRYLVYLSCNTYYTETYLYAPADFRVTAA